MPTDRNPGANEMPTPNSRLLTLATLKAKGACSEQVALFRRLFGKQVEVTETLCIEHARAFSWSWGACNLLSAQASDAYHEAIQQASDAFDAAIQPARDAYHTAQALAFASAYINDTKGN